MPDIVVAGHLCLDVIPHFFGGGFTLEPGGMTQVGEVHFATGGGVSNVGGALLKLGVDTRLLGRVGDDTFGRVVLELLQNAAPHVADGVATNPIGSTSYTIVFSPPGFDRHFLHHPGLNNSFHPSDIDVKLIEGAKIFYFGYPPLMKRVYEDGGAALAELLQEVKARGVLTVLDMTLPDPQTPAGRVDWQAFLERVLPHTDLFIPSLAETVYALAHERFGEEGWRDTRSPMPLVSELTYRMLEVGPAVAGLKLGEGGLYVKTATRERLEENALLKPLITWADSEFWSPAFDVQVKGTVGAGDAALAGFLTALLKGSTLPESLEMACAVGACSVEAPDATGGVLAWEKTVERLESWPRKPVSAPEGWQEGSRGVWVRSRGEA